MLNVIWCIFQIGLGVFMICVGVMSLRDNRIVKSTTEWNGLSFFNGRGDKQVGYMSLPDGTFLKVSTPSSKLKGGHIFIKHDIEIVKIPENIGPAFVLGEPK